MGPETGLPGAALAFEEPYTPSPDDSASDNWFGLVLWPNIRLQSLLVIVY